jgi:hypothetical protein
MLNKQWNMFRYCFCNLKKAITAMLGFEPCVGRVKAVNPYDEDTDVDDEELPATANLPLPQLHDFFEGKCFHLHGELSSVLRSKLKRYIIAFRG